MHTPYEKKLGHPSDFRVRYRFYSKEEGGRDRLPHQGYRSDFSYSSGDHHEYSMIWPEFEDTNGEVILEDDCPVPQSGTARMWIIIPERRGVHRQKITIGLIGYFMEGSRKVAECEVIDLGSLNSNPVQSK